MRVGFSVSGESRVQGVEECLPCQGPYLDQAEVLLSCLARLRAPRGKPESHGCCRPCTGSTVSQVPQSGPLSHRSTWAVSGDTRPL